MGGVKAEEGSIRNSTPGIKQVKGKKKSYKKKKTLGKKKTPRYGYLS